MKLTSKTFYFLLPFVHTWFFFAAIFYILINTFWCVSDRRHDRRPKGCIGGTTREKRNFPGTSMLIFQRFPFFVVFFLACSHIDPYSAKNGAKLARIYGHLSV